MKVCVQGLWHLGAVTSACLASVGHGVMGLDAIQQTVDNLSNGKAPIFEPGLDALIVAGLAAKMLSFTTCIEVAAAADVLWVTFDTPVDDDDQSDVNFVLTEIIKVLPVLKHGAVVLISSQMPVGSIRKLEEYTKQNLPNSHLEFACSPENLRLGKALDVFLKPDRIVVGLRSLHARQTLEELLSPVTNRIEWMTVESAEMTKHAINAFLATSVTFANEIASICELVGADAKEVERGLKTEMRIGPKAYLSPGGPFAGGTLARDIEFLGLVSQSKQLETPLLSSVPISNAEHKNWVRRKLLEQFNNLKGVTIAIWGLTYKPGTDTLRRSLAVELVDWLIEQEAVVQVYDPAAKQMPENWAGCVTVCSSAQEAVNDAGALVIGTDWPEFRQDAEASLSSADLVVIDAGRHLQEAVSSLGLCYITVGSSLSSER